MYLLDTNIWLERLLEQERATEVSQFLEAVPGSELDITDGTLQKWRPWPRRRRSTSREKKDAKMLGRLLNLDYAE